MLTVDSEIIWTSLLELKHKICSLSVDFESAVISINDQKAEVFINEVPDDNEDSYKIIIAKTRHEKFTGKYALFALDNCFQITFLENNFLDDSNLFFLGIYLPYCFAPIKAKFVKKAFAVSHFAQSLDGKIATNNGHSQWIGNNENLVHAHRMRSLCDGVLIGSKTLEKDRPSLTVRHVRGPDPVKIVIGNGDYDFGCLLKNGGKLIYVTSLKSVDGPEILRIEVNKTDGILDCNEILRRLFNEGIYSVYIEGGGYTASSFLNFKTIDVIQLHISPIIIGSGIADFSLPEIETVDKSIKFSDYHFFPLGNHILFSGTVKY